MRSGEVASSCVIKYSNISPFLSQFQKVNHTRATTAQAATMWRQIQSANHTHDLDLSFLEEEGEGGKKKEGCGWSEYILRTTKYCREVPASEKQTLECA